MKGRVSPRMNGRERIMDRLIKKQWRMDGRKNYFYCRTMMEYRMDIRGNGKWMSTVDQNGNMENKKKGMRKVVGGKY